jgi:hypothetical protein
MGAAAFGYISPVQGALLQEAIDVAVILNALRALREKTEYGLQDSQKSTEMSNRVPRAKAPPTVIDRVKDDASGETRRWRSWV